jgi:magnesium-transporting ATPase (P-type)
LSYAYKDFELDEFQKLFHSYGGFCNEAHRYVIESNLIFGATFWLSDPLRNNVEHVIYDLWEAGTNTRILSGDHKETVLKAALKVGIIEPGPTDNDMSGSEFKEKMLPLLTRNTEGIHGEISYDFVDEEAKLKFR